MQSESEYDFEINHIIKEIKRNNAGFIGLQFPDGLKRYAVEIADEIEKRTTAKTVIFTDAIYGACDTKEIEARIIGLDMIIHLGHTKFSNRKKI